MTPIQLAMLLLAAPFLAFVIGLVCFRKQHAIASGLTVLAGAVSLGCAVMLLLNGPIAEPITTTWLSSNGMDIGFGVLLDAPTLLMGLIVTSIALCVEVYALSYMSHDPGRGRFFSFLGLFSWAMLSFVYSANLLQAFIFWELVGLASFLLIGFWYQKPSAVAAAKKAFIMTRIGDVGLFIGLIFLLTDAGTLDITVINQPETVAMLADGRLDLITLLMFMGIVGKSAQFPLHTWLPDAMEGPTPVSALLHSATMVAAGVFLFARFHPLFMAAPATLEIVLLIASITAFLAATMAVVVLDMKRVLAFSSISQLGYMLMGLASGGLFAGMFHLTTHAIFKALLFLVAGAYIHHVGSNDMIAIGRAGGRKMKATTIGLVAGGAALAGIPPFAGFFSKEAILHEVGTGGHTIPLVLGFAAAFLTAYYTFRMIFLVIRPNPQSAAVEQEAAGAQFDDDHHHDDHDAAPWPMRAPILLLALGAVVAGFFGDALGAFLGLEVIHPPLAEMAPAIGIALAGVAMAWWDFGRASAEQVGFISKLTAVHTLLVNQWFIDRLYFGVIVRRVIDFARLCFGFEQKGVDGGTDAIGLRTIAAGDSAAESQAGWLQVYIATAIVVVSVLSLYLSL
jgi:NADH-quinone oxidoreductase subunit L